MGAALRSRAARCRNEACSHAAANVNNPCGGQEGSPLWCGIDLVRASRITPETELELVTEVIAGLQDVFSCKFDEVGGIRRRVLHERLRNF